MSHRLPDKYSDPEGYAEEQARRMRAARLKNEADDRKWLAALDAERAKPIAERRYLSFGDVAARQRQPNIVEELFDWVERRLFARTEVAALSGDPPLFRPFELGPGNVLVPDPDQLFLSRDGYRRFAKEKAGTAGLFRDWLGAPRRRGNGRVPKPVWEAATTEAMRWLEDNGCPEPGDGEQAALEKHIHDWLDERGYNAAESTVRVHVTACFPKFRAKLGLIA